MRSLLAIVFAFASLLSSPAVWTAQQTACAEGTGMAGKACACCAKKAAACDCSQSTPDRAPQPVPLSADGRLHAPACPCEDLAVLMLPLPAPALTTAPYLPSRHWALRHGPQVPVFILHCASLC